MRVYTIQRNSTVSPYHEGIQAGKDGKRTYHNPYPKGTQAHVDWLHGLISASL